MQIKEEIDRIARSTEIFGKYPLAQLRDNPPEPKKLGDIPPISAGQSAAGIGVDVVETVGVKLLQSQIGDDLISTDDSLSNQTLLRLEFDRSPRGGPTRRMRPNTYLRHLQGIVL